MKNKMTVIAVFVAELLSWADLSQAAHKADAGFTTETSVAATPAWENFKPSLGTWAEGTLATLRDADAPGGQLWLQLDYTLPEEWRVGILNNASFAYASDVNLQWAQLRLLAEKEGFVDTGSVGNKFVLRVEPRTTQVTKDGKIVDVYSRFDFTFPLHGALNFKLREEPRFDFNEHGLMAVKTLTGTESGPVSDSYSDFFYNGIELGPVFALGSFLWNINLINWQRINNGNQATAGYGVDSYIEYGLTDHVFLDLYAKYSSPYTSSAELLEATEWALEAYYVF